MSLHNFISMQTGEKPWGKPNELTFPWHSSYMAWEIMNDLEVTEGTQEGVCGLYADYTVV